MATANPVQVVEKNPGPKIEWRQNGTRLVFGDDDLTVRCDTRQRDWPVHEDICMDDNGNLKIGLGKYYIAQIDIPAKTYTDPEPTPDPEPDENGETEPASESGGEREALPLDMADVVLTLWNIGNLN